MGERTCRVSDVELCFETFGDERDPLVLLVMGLGLDMGWWHEDLCAQLAGRGLRVVRFDNRDCGRSTAFATAPGGRISTLQILRRRAQPTYSLADMADDAAGLIAQLDARGAHVVGVSLGAFIAQEVAIRHPELTRSLVSVMGRPGDGRTGRVAWRMRPEFVRPPGRDPIEAMVRTFRRIGSAGRTAADDDDVRSRLLTSARREQGDGTGSGRQIAAIFAERDRTADLRRLAVPALVVHGDRDRVVLPSGGRATAAAIPGAELMMVEGMGHDLPRWVWPALLDGIVRTARRSGAAGVR